MKEKKYLFLFIISLSFLFDRCDHEEVSAKSNNELYISDIISSKESVKIFANVYGELAMDLLYKENDDDNNHVDIKKIFEEDFKKEQNKLGVVSSFFSFNVNYDLLLPIYKNDVEDAADNESSIKEIDRVALYIPTDTFINFRIAAQQEQVLISNKMLIFNMAYGYLVQLKNNMKTWIKNEDDNEIKNFDKEFNENVLIPLFTKSGLRNIMSNYYKKGEENYNNSGEEKSIFDLLPTVFNFIDNNEFVINFYCKHILKEQNDNKQPDPFPGLLWLIYPQPQENNNNENI